MQSGFVPQICSVQRRYWYSSDGLAPKFVSSSPFYCPMFYYYAATLNKSRSNGEAVIISSHVPILPKSAIPSCMLWNFQDVLDLIHKHNDACASRHGRIVSIFSGHFHGGRIVSDCGILYVSLKSPLLSPNAYYSVSFTRPFYRCLYRHAPPGGAIRGSLAGAVATWCPVRLRRVLFCMIFA